MRPEIQAMYIYTYVPMASQHNPVLLSVSVEIVVPSEESGLTGHQRR